MKFRRTCGGCNATFFATDRRAIYCPKCLRKKQEQRAPTITEAATTRPHGNQQRSSQIRPKNASASLKPVAAQPPKQRTPRPPKTALLNDELKSKIEAAYNQLKDSMESLKKLHAKISHDLWAKPMVVAEVVKKLHQKPVKTEHCTLSEEQRELVINLYLDLIRSGARPQEGRRSFIAKELNLPPREVILAVREWSTTIMGQLSRKQLFEIEKEYWRSIEQGNHKFAELPQLISEHVGFATIDQVTRWLDQLHDFTKVTKNTNPLSEEQANHVIEQYHLYLQQAEPPEESLHWTLARKLGVLPSQVHRALCEYRCSRKPE
jgi:hypothetical protein